HPVIIAGHLAERGRPSFTSSHARTLTRRASRARTDHEAVTGWPGWVLAGWSNSLVVSAAWLAGGGLTWAGAPKPGEGIVAVTRAAPFPAAAGPRSGALSKPAPGLPAVRHLLPARARGRASGSVLAGPLHNRRLGGKGEGRYRRGRVRHKKNPREIPGKG